MQDLFYFVLLLLTGDRLAVRKEEREKRKNNEDSTDRIRENGA